MKISVIIPVLNGGEDLAHCLDALAASGRLPDELILADDGSTDGSAELARGRGAFVVRVADGPLGPAHARNRAAEQATGDTLVFIDSDVTVLPEALGRIEAHLAANPDVAALFGSYDDDPPARGIASRYKNLLHHKTHQESRREASTFWAGCGAVRADDFREVGGFDESYRRPSIEDIELGVRLRKSGRRVWSCPDVLSKHRKRWTLLGMVRTDILCRAVPWTSLIVRSGQLPNDLNTGLSSRISALAAWLLIASALFGLFWQPAWIASAVAALTWFACNADILRFFARQGGAGFALGAAGLHLLYYLYSSATFAVVAASTRLSMRDPAGTPGETVVVEPSLAN